MALVVESVASQAAITIQNVRYIKEIRELFYSFVRVMSSVIDERTSYNASHARHMAEQEEKLDPELTRLFIESRCWEEPV